MKLSRILKQILTEKKGDAYEANCAMLYFNLPELKNIHKMIDKDDLFTEEGDRSYGIEDEPHITLLFGLDPKVPLHDVQGIINNHNFTSGKLVNASLFKNEKYDVLKFDVDSDSQNELSEINKELKEFPYKNDYPDYHPHCTIAYLKPGKGQKYVDELKEVDFSFIPSRAVYSESNGTKHNIKIKLV